MVIARVLESLIGPSSFVRTFRLIIIEFVSIVLFLGSPKLGPVRMDVIKLSILKATNSTYSFLNLTLFIVRVIIGHRKSSRIWRRSTNILRSRRRNQNTRFRINFTRKNIQVQSPNPPPGQVKPSLLRGTTLTTLLQRGPYLISQPLILIITFCTREDHVLMEI